MKKSGMKKDSRKVVKIVSEIKKNAPWTAGKPSDSASTPAHTMSEHDMCGEARLRTMGGFVVLIVDEEAPEQDVMVLAASKGAAVDVGAHFNGDFKLYAAVAKKGEEQPRIKGRKGTLVLGSSAQDAAVLE